jgi:hypothetical protein
MTDVFNQENSGETQQEQIEDYLSHLVGEDKKFKSPEELARGKWEADNYIKTLERQMDEARKELEKRQTADEIADRIKSELAGRGESNQESHQTPEENNDSNNNDRNKLEGLSREELLKLFDERLSEREQKSKAQQNREEVSKTLSEKVGATANKWLQDKAQELGVSVQYLQEQAEVSPKAFYNLVGLNQTSSGNTGWTPPQSSTNTAGRLDSGTQVRDNAYYEKLFKDSPKLRFDPKLTVQMHKDAQKMGPDFFK